MSVQLLVRQTRSLILAFFSTVMVWTSCLAWSSEGSGAEYSSLRVSFQAQGVYVIVEALGDELIHVETSAVGSPNTAKQIDTTPMVFKTAYAGPTKFTTTATGFETSSLSVSVDPQSLCVTGVDLRRSIHLATICPKNMTQAWKSLEIISPQFTSVHGLGQYFSDPPTEDGDWMGRVWDPQADGFGAKLRGFHGGANNFSMFPIMYALGSGTKNFAFFLDNIYKQKWDFRARPWTVSMWGDQLRYYIIAGDNLPALRKTYMDLTGKPPVPPKRSFGLWVSEFGFQNWGEIRATLKTLRDQAFPVEGFGLDLQWFGGTFGEPERSRMGSLTWDERNFPDAAVTVRRFKDEDGVRMMLIEEPYISDRLGEFSELAARNFLVRDCASCGPTHLDHNPWWGYGGMMDFTSAAAAGFWHDYRRLPLAAMGINDHWLDLGEPEQYNSWSWYSGFPETKKHNQADVHNIYGMKWAESISTGYLRNQSRDRSFILSRTGTSGIQRFGTALWSGDIGSDWVNLRSQMHVQMQMSLSGVDYYGSDVGGFQRQTGSIEGSSESLYTQWLANSAAFDVPVRPHAWNLDKQRSTSPAVRGSRASNLGNVRQRYAFSPYYYSLAHQAARVGEPLFPPPFYYFQDDVTLRTLGNIKMIGPSLLAAVVAKHGAISRPVYLPRGEWINFHSNEWFVSAGEEFRDISTYYEGLFKLPLFARAGAIIPMMATDSKTMNINGKRTDGSRQTQLLLRVYPSSQRSSFTLVEDDGETTDYLQGEIAETQVNQVSTPGAVQIDISAVKGTYRGAPREREILIDLVTHDKRAAGVTVNGLKLSQCQSLPKWTNENSCWSHQAPNKVAIKTSLLPVNERHTFTIQTVDVSPTTSVLFSCANGVTTPGTSVYVLGNLPELGNGDPAQAVKLDPNTYPTWSRLISGLAPDRSLTWKCLKRHEQDAQVVAWQVGNNSIVTGTSSYSGLSTGAFQ